MSKLTSLIAGLLVLASVATASAGERSRIRFGFLRTAFQEQAPVPAPEGQALPAPAQPMPAPEGYSAPQAHPAPQHVAAFTNVEVEDRHNIHPCAVPKVIMVPDPCACHTSCCAPACVPITICVPPCGCEDVKIRDGGRKQDYDYGEYEVEIRVRDGYVKVDYDD